MSYDPITAEEKNDFIYGLIIISRRQTWIHKILGDKWF